MLNESEPIIARLRLADRFSQKEKGAAFIVDAVPWLLGFMLACFIFDVFLQLDTAARLQLLIVFGAGVGLIGLWGLATARWRRNRLEHIARVLESRSPELGSKLINFLQLQDQAGDPSLSPVSREMAGLAVAGYAEELGRVDFLPLARSGRLRRCARRTFFMGGGLFLVLLAFFPVSLPELARFADPYGDHPPYAFTRLKIVQPGTKGASVVYGKSFVVKADYSGHRPRDLFLTFHPPDHPEQAATVPMFNNGPAGFYQQVDNIKSDLVLVAHTGNRHSYSKQAHVQVILTPRFEKAFLRSAPPAYTRLPEEEKPFDFKNVRVLAGTRLHFRIQSNRPLREGTMQWLNLSGQMKELALHASPEREFEVEGDLEARESGTLRFSVLDRDGIPSDELREAALNVTHDLAPEVRVIQPAQDCYVSLGFNVDAQIEANDDYGLLSLRVHHATNGVYAPPQLISYQELTRTGRETIRLQPSGTGSAQRRHAHLLRGSHRHRTGAPPVAQPNG